MKKYFVVLLAVGFLSGLTGMAQAQGWGTYDPNMKHDPNRTARMKALDKEYFNCFTIGPCDRNQKQALLRKAVDDPEAFEAFLSLFQAKGGVSLATLQAQQNQKIIELLTQIKNK